MISSAYITLKWLVEIIGFKGDGVPKNQRVPMMLFAQNTEWGNHICVE